MPKTKTIFPVSSNSSQNKPALKKILEGKNQSSRVSNCSNQWADYGIEIEPCTTIKAQTLADFIAETMETILDDPNQEWRLYVDGSSTRSSSGAGIIMISSIKVKMEHAVCFEFAASNNEAEYEASTFVTTLGLE